MIQLETLRVHEFRGLRELLVDFGRNNLVVSGPNGSGKSGVVDAIQFALTGVIGRLAGEGTGDLTLSAHGPHVLSGASAGDSWVKLEVFIPSIGTSASIERSVQRPARPTIEPSTPEVVRIFEWVASHSEVSLSRREIIKFILASDGKRSADVQNLLRLSGIDDSRRALQRTRTRLREKLRAANDSKSQSKQSVLRHFDRDKLTASDILEVVNEKRATLALSPLPSLGNGMNLTAGLPARSLPKPVQSVASAQADLAALNEVIEGRHAGSTIKELASLNANLQRVADEPDLRKSLKRLRLIEEGLPLVEEDECPLCELSWGAAVLREHLAQRLQQSREAAAIRDQINYSRAALTSEVRRIAKLAESFASLPEAHEFRSALQDWSDDLGEFAAATGSGRTLKRHRQRLAGNWTNAPAALAMLAPKVGAALASRPAQDAVLAARDFLLVAQERLQSWIDAARTAKHLELVSARADVAHETFVHAADLELTSLYRTVEGEFAALYATINEDEAATFSATLTPSSSALKLGVDFFGHGLCPPGAYHSEGHQDAMGLCLYLALVRQSMGRNLTLVVLDDVVMSVDSAHRRNICRMLKSSFPDVQFVITTHDQVWARQMRTEGLVDAKHTLAFQSWSVETGPIVEAVPDIWPRIEADLASSDVAGAAARLRRHLEFVSAELADMLAANVPFKGDNAYDLGDLLPSVIGRQRELLKKASNAANSWNQREEVERVRQFLSVWSESQRQQNDDGWMINKSVHFVEWANLTPAEFRPLVEGYQKFLSSWRCSICDSWLTISSRREPGELRCACSNLRFNLMSKS